MFNKSPYNRALYNRRASFVFEWAATAKAESAGGGALIIRRHMDSSVYAGSAASGIIIRVVLPEGTAAAQAETLGDYIRTLFLSGAADAVSGSEGAGVSTRGQEVLTVAGVDMNPGDELVIDTEHMTVTLNGVNIVDRVSDDSIFFKLKAGINDIAVDGSTAADIRILWKDRWL